MSQGKKFVEQDLNIVKKREEAQKDLENPYFLATDENDQNAVQQTAQLADQEVIKTDKEKEQELDLSNFVQLEDDMWGSMVHLDSMTDATIELNNPNRVIKPSKEQMAKEAAEKRAKQLEAEEKAAQEARDELLKPEVVD